MIDVTETRIIEILTGSLEHARDLFLALSQGLTEDVDNVPEVISELQEGALVLGLIAVSAREFASHTRALAEESDASAK